VTISTRVRWIRFNLVGVMGFALQTMTLWLLVRWAGVNASVAITLAVLAAVSHNFAWHETVTWPNLPAERRSRRWLYFQFSTGAISLLTNLGITMIVNDRDRTVRRALQCHCRRPGVRRKFLDQ
jgi:putative flippase GtrA